MPKRNDIEYYGRAALLRGDAPEWLRRLPANFFEATMTDPPYGIDIGGSAGQSWDEGEAANIAFQPELWAEVFRVMKPGGFVAAFNASRQEHRLSGAMERAGFRIQDRMLWMYSQSMPRGQDLRKSLVVHPDLWAVDYKVRDVTLRKWKGWRIKLRPNYEPVVLAQKPLEGDIASNVLKHGCGGLNIDACRFGPEGTFPGNVALIRPGEEWPADDQLARYDRHFYSAKATEKDRAGSEHLTVKPISVVEHMLKLICPPGARVLDCFAGSGTMATAAFGLDDRGYRLQPFLIEREPTFQRDIVKRLEQLRTNHGRGRIEKPKLYVYSGVRPVDAPAATLVASSIIRVEPVERGARIPWGAPAAAGPASGGRVRRAAGARRDSRPRRGA